MELGEVGDVQFTGGGKKDLGKEVVSNLLKVLKEEGKGKGISTNVVVWNSETKRLQLLMECH